MTIWRRKAEPIIIPLGYAHSAASSPVGVSDSRHKQPRVRGPCALAKSTLIKPVCAMEGQLARLERLFSLSPFPAFLNLPAIPCESRANEEPEDDLAAAAAGVCFIR